MKGPYCSKVTYALKFLILWNDKIYENKSRIKIYKVCDSTNSYCLVFDLYVRQTDVSPPVSKYGKTHNLVISILERYTEKGYIVYMDN